MAFNQHKILAMTCLIATYSYETSYARADEFVCKTIQLHVLKEDGKFSTKQAEDDVFVFNAASGLLHPIYLETAPYRYEVLDYEKGAAVTVLSARLKEINDELISSERAGAVLYINAPGAFILSNALYVKTGTCELRK